MDELKIKKVLVVGAGTMGSGIAQWFAQIGIDTQICDIQKDFALAAEKRIYMSWEKLKTKGKFSEEQVTKFEESLDAIDFSEIDPETDLVIEAIIEDKEAKLKVFKELETKLPNAWLSSNTSSIPISSMQRELERKDKFLGLHFFNPAPIMKLVEVIRGHWTSEQTASSFKKFFDDAGKKAAICKDSPGFIVNRVARNFYGESFRILGSVNENNVPEHDRIMKESGGFRMGPFELMDLIGIDVNYDVTQSVWKDYYYEPRFALHAIQRQMVESGRYGKKTGEGFYRYD